MVRRQSLDHGLKAFAVGHAEVVRAGDNDVLMTVELSAQKFDALTQQHVRHVVVVIGQHVIDDELLLCTHNVNHVVAVGQGLELLDVSRLEFHVLSAFVIRCDIITFTLDDEALTTGQTRYSPIIAETTQRVKVT